MFLTWLELGLTSSIFGVQAAGDLEKLTLWVYSSCCAFPLPCPDPNKDLVPQRGTREGAGEGGRERERRGEREREGRGEKERGRERERD